MMSIKGVLLKSTICSIKEDRRIGQREKLNCEY